MTVLEMMEKRYEEASKTFSDPDRALVAIRSQEHALLLRAARELVDGADEDGSGSEAIDGLNAEAKP